jgi:hypothetical protein
MSGAVNLPAVAWEWVGPVATGIVGVAGVIGTAKVASGGRSHDERMAREARVASHESWHRDRRAMAYASYLDQAVDQSEIVARAFPIMDTDPPAELVPMPSVERQRAAWVQIQAYAPRSIKELARSWDALTRRALWEAEAISRHQKNVEARRRLDDLRPQVRDALMALTDAIADDLAMTPDARDLARERDQDVDGVALPARMLVQRGPTGESIPGDR